MSGTEEKCFIVRIFCNWKGATRQFTKHEASLFHEQPVDSFKIKTDVAEMLSSQHVEKERNQQYLLHVITAIRIACKGVALRGDSDDSNFFSY